MIVTLGDSEISIKEFIILETGMFSFFVATNGEAKRVRRWGQLPPWPHQKLFIFSISLGFSLLYQLFQRFKTFKQKQMLE